MRIAVDTSAVIAVIAGEVERSRLIELTREATVVAPPSMQWEVGNAFSAMLKRSRLNLEQAIEAIELYQEISIEIVDVDMREAIRLANKHKIYAYDAYVLQCAIEQKLPLITLDKTMLEIARREGIRVIEVVP